MTTDSSSAFEALHPRVQRWIWSQGWAELRDIQEHAVREVLASDADVVIASATASGKTEAAFLPIGSTLLSEGATGLSVLYLSPLKALINDQHRRLENFFGALDVPVHKWHGDVAASVKQKVVREPSGALLITPESLEALFVRQGSRAPGLLTSVRFIVVDELHAFIGAERGRQLQSLMSRVELAAGRRIPRIALSATLGDMDLACDFLRPGHAGSVRRVISTANRQEVQLQIRGYRVRPPILSDEQVAKAEAEGREIELEQVASGDALEISLDLFQRLRGGRHIVFANRRADVELYTDLLRRRCERERLPNEFWPHHGSLNRDLREEAEDALRASDRPATVLATSTLELGIDVGAVESIAQLGPPPSVASMRQRLGRSGRRGSPAVMRVYVQEAEITATTPPQAQLRTDLVQSIAMVRLLAQRWYEPPAAGALHLSTLVQQVLSAIAERGAERAERIWDSLSRNGPFRGVDAPMFAKFLRDIAGHDLIMQTHDGELVLGLTGERIVNHYDFYSAFTSPEEYRLVSGPRTLGTLPVTYPLADGMHIIFGGRRWRVLSIDPDKKVVDLAPAGGGRAPNFGGSAALVHDRVRQEMLSVYVSDDRPGFVDSSGLELLKEARGAFRRFELDDRLLLPWGSDTLVFSWAGDRIMNTLLLQLVSRGLQVYREGVALLVSGVGEDDTRQHLMSIASAPAVAPADLAASVRNKVTQKHHRFLGEHLLSADYASSHLDTMGTHDLLSQKLPRPRRTQVSVSTDSPDRQSAVGVGVCSPGTPELLEHSYAPARSSVRRSRNDVDEHGQPHRKALNRVRRSERSTSELIGMAKAIISDREVTPAEVSLLVRWFDANPEAALSYPGNVLARRLERILPNDALEADELEDLSILLAELTGAGLGSIAAANAATTLPLDRPPPDLSFDGSLWVFTGTMAYGPREICEQEVAVRGGQCASVVTTRTDYLVIGTIGSRDWAHTTHGRKIEQAVDFRSRGIPLAIVGEDHWAAALEG